MIMLIIISIIVGSITYILWPVWQSREAITSSPLGTNGHLADLVDQRDNLLAVLKDLESDRHMGKLTADDFENLQNNYRAQTIQVLEDIDQLSMDTITDSKIKPRSSNHGGQMVSEDEKFCTICGAVALEQDEYCSHCGNGIS